MAILSILNREATSGAAVEARSVPPGEQLATRPVIAPLLATVGADEQVPLVTGARARYVELDHAASTPALTRVADHVAEVLPLYASVHRGAGYRSQVTTRAYELARETIAAFVGARADDVTVITRNTTDALNLLVRCTPGDTVRLDCEHHAALLPGDGRVVPAAATVIDTLRALDAELLARPAALVVVAGASNVTGERLPLDEVADLVHRHGARLAVDGAQLVPHRRVDVSTLGIDYLAFSGHKTYAPFGAGALVGRADWLDAAEPYLAGGGAVRSVRVDGDRAVADWTTGAARHEAGSPNVLGAIALAEACRALADLPDGAAEAHEQVLHQRLEDGLADVPGVRLLRQWPDSTDRVGIVTLTVDGVPAGLIAACLSAEYGIGVRDGRFCAHPVVDRIAPDGAVRLSLGVGSSSTDVERVVAALRTIAHDGPRCAYREQDGRWVSAVDPRPLPDVFGGARLDGVDLGGTPCRPVNSAS